MASSSKVPALRLVLGGAPSVWHTLSPVNDQPHLRGYFHPDKPSPLGGPGEPSVEDAKAFIAAHRKLVAQAAKDWADFPAAIGDFQEPPCPVELVEISQKEADEARSELAELQGVAQAQAEAAIERGEGALPNVESQAAAAAATQEG